MIERDVRLLLVGVVAGLPEAAARAANVPVGQIFDEGNKRANGALKIVVIHRGGDFLAEIGQRAFDPLVEQVVALPRLRITGLPVVDIGVGDEKAVGIPERNE